MTDETHRFFRITDRSQYESLCATIDTNRGFPDDEGTARGLPTWDFLFQDPETQVDRLYCIPVGYLETEQEELQGCLDSGAFIEITLAVFFERLHWEEPVVIEDEDEFELPTD